MPIPIVCLDVRVRQWAACFRECFSKPQYQHFVTVLLGLLLCQEARTLTGLRRQVAGGASVASLSRFLARAPWDEAAVARAWRARFDTHAAPLVQAARDHQRQTRPRQVGRPKEPLVIGYLIGDDSTLAKPKGTTMEGVGHHYSSTADARVRGHSLVQGLYVLQGRRCPLAPQLYQQKSVCAARRVPFRSKIALMEEQIRTFAPVAGTQTHVLLDSWYGAKSLWKAARDRRFLITTGLKGCVRTRNAIEPLRASARSMTRLLLPTQPAPMRTPRPSGPGTGGAARPRTPTHSCVADSGNDRAVHRAPCRSGPLR